MTDKIAFLRSYAHAESLGIVPCDSIIGTVYDASKDQVLAMEKGHTFSSRDKTVTLARPMRTFEFFVDDVLDETVDDADLTVNATREFFAKVLFFEKFGHVKARLFERITKSVSLGDARMNPVSGPRPTNGSRKQPANLWRGGRARHKNFAI